MGLQGVLLVAHECSQRPGLVLQIAREHIATVCRQQIDVHDLEWGKYRPPQSDSSIRAGHVQAPSEGVLEIRLRMEDRPMYRERGKRRVNVDHRDGFSLTPG
jgi:hypothetical protein